MGSPEDADSAVSAGSDGSGGDSAAPQELRMRLGAGERSDGRVGAGKEDEDEDEDDATAWLDNFFFQQRHGKLHVRKLARIDLAQVIEQVDVDTLQDVLENIAFCNLKINDLKNMSDATIVKAFRVAQLIIEYLLNLENSLFAKIDLNKQRTIDLEKGSKELAEDIQVLAEDNARLKKELRQRRKALATFEHVLKIHGPSGLTSAAISSALAGFSKDGHSSFDLGGTEANVCSTCGKAFSTLEYLRRHCLRRKHSFDNAGQENLEPNFPGTKWFQKLEAKFEEQSRLKDEEISNVRQSERKLYEDQLNLLKQERQSHEERLQDHYRNQLSQQQIYYEQRIASLETKLQMYQEFRRNPVPSEADSASRMISSEDSRRFKAEVLETELQIHKSVQNRVSTFEGSQEINQELNETTILKTKFRDAVERNFVRSLVAVTRTHDKLSISQAFFRLKMESMLFSFRKAKKDLLATIQRSEEIEPRASSQFSPKEEIASHVAAHTAVFENNGVGKPISDEKVQQLSHRFMHAQRENSISKQERLAMDEVSTLLDSKAAVLNSSFKGRGQQRINNIPMPNKPYIRSVWEHSESDIYRESIQVRAELQAKMREYDPGLPDMMQLSNEQFAFLKKQMDSASRTSNDDEAKKALNAVRSLVADISNVFYRASDEEGLPEFPRPHDKLLQEALVPIKQRSYAARPRVNSMSSSKFSSDEDDYYDDFEVDVESTIGGSSIGLRQKERFLESKVARIEESPLPAPPAFSPLQNKYNEVQEETTKAETKQGDDAENDFDDLDEGIIKKRAKSPRALQSDALSKVTENSISKGPINVERTDNEDEEDSYASGDEDFEDSDIAENESEHKRLEPPPKSEMNLETERFEQSLESAFGIKEGQSQSGSEVDSETFEAGDFDAEKSRGEKSFEENLAIEEARNEDEQKQNEAKPRGAGGMEENSSSPATINLPDSFAEHANTSKLVSKVIHTSAAEMLDMSWDESSISSSEER